MTAAVSDFTTDKKSGKISRDSGNFQLNLIPNIDLVKTIKDNYDDIITVAFSAQVNDDLNFEKIKKQKISRCSVQSRIFKRRRGYKRFYLSR